MPPCTKGGEIEDLAGKAAEAFVPFRGVCTEIFNKKKEELELVNAIGWKSGETATGLVLAKEEVTADFEKVLAHEQNTAIVFFLEDLEKTAEKIFLHPNKSDIEEFKGIYESLIQLAGDKVLEAGKPYNEICENMFSKLLEAEALRADLKALKATTLQTTLSALDEAIHSLRSSAHNQMMRNSDDAVAMEAGVRSITMFVCLLSVVFSVGYGLFVTSGINRRLSSIVQGLTKGAEQVASACSQVSSASHSVARGASQQAAAIEETSSALEEMASMTKSNADHGVEADRLTEMSDQELREVKTSMEEMTASMGKISNASEKRQRSLRLLTRSLFRQICLLLMRQWKPPEPVKPAPDLPWWPMKSEAWRDAPPMRQKIAPYSLMP